MHCYKHEYKDGQLHTATFEMDNQHATTVYSSWNSAKPWDSLDARGGLRESGSMYWYGWAPYTVHLEPSQHCQSAIPQDKHKIQKKKITKIDLLYSIGNSTQYSDNLYEKWIWERMNICITEHSVLTEHFAIHLKLTQHEINCTPIKDFFKNLWKN